MLTFNIPFPLNVGNEPQPPTQGSTEIRTNSGIGNVLEGILEEPIDYNAINALPNNISDGHILEFGDTMMTDFNISEKIASWMNISYTLPELPSLMNITEFFPDFSSLANVTEYLPTLPSLANLTSYLPDLPSLSSFTDRLPDDAPMKVYEAVKTTFQSFKNKVEPL
mmetsp:Transcript_25825/g.25102  ORF Transcript_25825/g.25102 Transcript_25825/m.25102 type:complete len:167 (+) Transcript_25825:100-600(+)